MTTVFISGSITIKNLHPLVIERIKKIVNQRLNIVVGDANGVDSSIQHELFKLGCQNVTVYCSSPKPRNNLGGWDINAVKTDYASGTRAFFTVKDIQMAKDADCGLMIWDSKSTGTLKNVIELLALNKKSVVFVNKLKEFFVIKSINDLEILISKMSDSALAKAEDKINLSNELNRIQYNQIALI